MKLHKIKQEIINRVKEQYMGICVRDFEKYQHSAHTKIAICKLKLVKIVHFLQLLRTNLIGVDPPSYTVFWICLPNLTVTVFHPFRRYLYYFCIEHKLCGNIFVRNLMYNNFVLRNVCASHGYQHIFKTVKMHYLTPFHKNLTRQVVKLFVNYYKEGIG